ncbi:MAG TPA: hypothetical protein VF183_01730 [Acidimicrobiales bacterium]
MDPAVPLSVEAPRVSRSEADRRMRRILCLPVDGPRASIMAANSAASRSIMLSATRCLLTYVVLPVVAPLAGLSGGVGPVLGLILGTVSMVAIVAAARRFFAADHRWRWHYLAVGSAIMILLIVQAAIDIADLTG